MYFRWVCTWLFLLFCSTTSTSQSFLKVGCWRNGWEELQFINMSNVSQKTKQNKKTCCYMVTYGEEKKKKKKNWWVEICFSFLCLFVSFLFLCFCLLNLNKVLPYIVFLLLGYFSFFSFFSFKKQFGWAGGYNRVIGLSSAQIFLIWSYS